MSKTFKRKNEFDKWIANFRKNYMEKHGKNLFDQMMVKGLTDDDYICGLISDGYTDLDNLVEDGHDYQIGSHTNNGWIFRDELDYFSNIPEERIRDR